MFWNLRFLSLMKESGEGEIRTHVGLRPTAFRERPVMTTSVPLQNFRHQNTLFWCHRILSLMKVCGASIFVFERFLTHQYNLSIGTAPVGAPTLPVFRSACVGAGLAWRPPWPAAFVLMQCVFGSAAAGGCPHPAASRLRPKSSLFKVRFVRFPQLTSKRQAVRDAEPLANNTLRNDGKILPPSKFCRKSKKTAFQAEVEGGNKI